MFIEINMMRGHILKAFSGLLHDKNVFRFLIFFPQLNGHFLGSGNIGFSSSMWLFSSNEDGSKHNIQPTIIGSFDQWLPFFGGDKLQWSWEKKLKKHDAFSQDTISWYTGDDKIGYVNKKCSPSRFAKIDIKKSHNI